MPFEFEYKQVIVLRTDIRMSKGKAAVQVAHAAVSAAEEARKKFRNWWKAWLKEGQRKIVVKVKTLEELLTLEQKVKKANLPHALIRDMGLTEIPPETITCLGIGPAPAIKVDEITNELPLL
jgi:PTH2 family peptidyl-tRNA hydrolase